MADYDRRIVDLYDEDNPAGPDHEFYRELADTIHATTPIDLGCGTGNLTVTLAHSGRSVVGVDPSLTMLDHARRRDGTDRVEWIHGDSRDIRTRSVDLAIMTGNVPQHINDRDWARTLRDVRRSLRQGGALAFESRNPRVRAWAGWSSRPTTRQTMHGPLVEWATVHEATAGAVEVAFHNRFTDTGEDVVQNETLHFRDRASIESELNRAGFEIAAVYGDWRRGPLDDESAEMIFVASAVR